MQQLPGNFKHTAIQVLMKLKQADLETKVNLLHKLTASSQTATLMHLAKSLAQQRGPMLSDLPN